MNQVWQFWTLAFLIVSLEDNETLKLFPEKL